MLPRNIILSLLFAFACFTPLHAQVAGALDGAFDPNVTGSVFATAVQPDGKIVLAGQVTAVGGSPRPRVTRLDAAGNAEAVVDFNNGTGPNNDVYCVAVQPDGRIVIGGLFATVNALSRNRIARLNADGSVEGAATFNPGTGFAGGDVYSVAVQADGKIVVAGSFTTLNNVTNNRIARLNADGTVDTAFTAAVGAGANGLVRSVAVQADGRIVIAGDFTAVTGQARGRIARLGGEGTLEGTATFNTGTGADTTVYCVAQQGDGKLVVAGNFTTLNLLPRVRYGRLHADGTVDPTFTTGTGASALVNSVALQTNGKILIAGNFTAVAGAPRNSIARLNVDGSVEGTGSFNAGTGANGGVRSVAVQEDGEILLGGVFTTVAGISRNSMARLANDAVTQSLAGATARVFWARSGAGPEVQQVAFESSVDGGVDWAPLGAGTRIAGGWELTGLVLAEPVILRVRARTTGGFNAGSGGLIEQLGTGDFTTQPPTLTAPVAGSVTKGVVGVSFTLPEAAQPGSVTVTFHDGVTARVLTLAAAQGTLGAHSFTFSPASPVATSGGAVTAGGAIPDGSYTVTLSYKDALENPAATASAAGVILDNTTQAPTLIAPANAQVVGGIVDVSFTLPEAAKPGTVRLAFLDGVTPRVLSLGASQEVLGAHSFNFMVSDPVGTSGGAVTAGVALPAGIFTVTLSYQDVLGNPVAARSATAVEVDLTTLAPTLTSPASGTASSALVSVAFSLPEAAAPGTVKLSFGANVLTLAASQATAGSHSFGFSPGNPPTAPEIASGAAIADGLYTVTLTYQDSFLNPAASTSIASVRIDRTAPTLTGTFSPLLIATGATLPNYAAQAVAGDVSAVAITQWPLSGTTHAPGAVTVTITATDALGNQSSIFFVVTVRPAVAGNNVFASQGDAVPGAGTVGGPPADARLASFGVPSTDAFENVAYTAKWTSPTAGKGSGIIRNNTSVATVGGLVPGLAGVSFKTFADPVLDRGRIGFLAKLKAVPASKAAVVLSDAPSGGLAIIARAGSVAPGTGGAVFKSFKSMAITENSVAIFAQVTGGIVNKTTTATDIGLWMQDSTRPLALVLREGQGVGQGIGRRTIKTLVAFLPGIGSPGQGRGWLTQTASGPEALALALFTDKSQAVLSVDIAGSVAVLSQSGPGGAGAPGIADANFASYSVPAMTEAGSTAFLGTLALGPGGVTKLNQRAIFLNTTGSAYDPVVVLGDTAQKYGVPNGSTFRLLKDPVLAADDGLAFFATLKGGSATGLAASTLWWKPPGAPLQLLAQGGKAPAGTPVGAQWKAFTSLAIAPSRGPIFTASLVLGKGAVLARNASGVWAVDFSGTTRLLFRTGDLLGTRKVKKFTLLNAAVGSVGVTRSFNDSGQLVWLATFTDKTTAIIKTEIP